MPWQDLRRRRPVGFDGSELAQGVSKDAPNVNGHTAVRSRDNFFEDAVDEPCARDTRSR